MMAITTSSSINVNALEDERLVFTPRNWYSGKATRLAKRVAFPLYQFRGVKTSRSSSRAFTLIELLVVIAIIAIRI